MVTKCQSEHGIFCHRLLLHNYFDSFHKLIVARSGVNKHSFKHTWQLLISLSPISGQTGIKCMEHERTME